MSVFFVILLIATITYLFIKFAQQEALEPFYQQAVLDIEGRLDWALSRSYYPFGMKAQIEVSDTLLHKAKDLRDHQQLHQAYQVALQSQHAIDNAQNIYIDALHKR
ncbi:hypothetical protein CW745_12050 [Psychromonas sp. psych-6C06]|uniref:hypothetical protein n=1 Tax=Psychromonas sp. psych-6C06 TaxID=2058089 RepID=UPI000C3301B4|nr:hypothetical protein [Psychromonas sp. psych-6C06]PKF61038.1 hypothetical protein CW745_12050 [Psychromonas sp. psych-6C06]